MTEDILKRLEIIERKIQNMVYDSKRNVTYFYGNIHVEDDVFFKSQPPEVVGKEETMTIEQDIGG